MTLADGVTLRVRGSALERVGRDDAVLSSSPLPRDYGCDVRAWGPAAALVCEDDIYRTTDGEALTLVLASAPRTRSFDRDLRLSADGLHLALGQPCAPRVVANDSPRVACVLLDGVGAWREVPFPTGYDGPWEMQGSKILFARCEAGVCRGDVTDADTGETRALTPASRPDASDLAIVSRPRWTRDGALVAVARRAGSDPSGPTWLLRGDPLEALPVQPLPPGTIDVVFDDRTRGIAVGSDLGSLARTLDGGRTWEALPVPLDGAVSNVWYEPRETRCEPEGCVISGLVTVRGWGPAQAEDPRWFSMIPASPSPVVRPASRAARSTQVRCVSDGHATVSPWGPEARGELSGSWLAGVARVQRSPDDGAAPETLTWAGEGVRAGRMTLRAGAMGEEFFVLGAGTRGPLLRAGEGLFPAWRGPRAAVLPLVGAFWGVQMQGVSERDALAIPAPDGGALALTGGSVGSVSLLLGARVTAAGTLAATRAVLADGVGGGLARVRGRDVIAQLGAGREVRVTPLDGGPTESLGALPERLGVCDARDAARDAAVITWAAPRSGDNLVEVESFRASALQVEVALSPRGACLRGLVGRGAWTDGANGLSLWLRASGGRLVGHRDEGRARAPLRCEVLP